VNEPVPKADDLNPRDLRVMKFVTPESVRKSRPRAYTRFPRVRPNISPGDDLLSHAVPLALEGLTSVFGMASSDLMTTGRF
jgi:hypothetical protein